MHEPTSHTLAPRKVGIPCLTDQYGPRESAQRSFATNQCLTPHPPAPPRGVTSTPGIKCGEGERYSRVKVGRNTAHLHPAAHAHQGDLLAGGVVWVNGGSDAGLLPPAGRALNDDLFADAGTSLGSVWVTVGSFAPHSHPDLTPPPPASAALKGRHEQGWGRGIRGVRVIDSLLQRVTETVGENMRDFRLIKDFE